MSGYQVPAAVVSPLLPQGFKVSIPHEEGITLFAFHGKLNKPIVNLSDQDWAADIIRPTKGCWVYENRDVLVRPKDVLFYWLTVRYLGKDYHAMGQQAQFTPQWIIFWFKDYTIFKHKIVIFQRTLEIYDWEKVFFFLLYPFGNLHFCHCHWNADLLYLLGNRSSRRKTDLYASVSNIYKHDFINKQTTWEKSTKYNEKENERRKKLYFYGK